MAVACLLPTKGAAQWGIKMGTFASHFSEADGCRVKKNTGFVGGVVYQKKFLGGLSIQPEALYVKKRATITDEATFERNKVRLHCLQVPINLQYGFNLLLLRPYFQLTPYVNYIFGKSASLHLPWDEIDRTSFGIGVGGGVEIWMLQLSLRYNWDFSHSVKIGDGKHSKISGLEFGVAIIL